MRIFDIAATVAYILDLPTDDVPAAAAPFLADDLPPASRASNASTSMATYAFGLSAGARADGLNADGRAGGWMVERGGAGGRVELRRLNAGRAHISLGCLPESLAPTNPLTPPLTALRPALIPFFAHT